MKATFSWAGCLGLTALALAMTAVADEATGDLKTMQGTWTSTLNNGEEARWVFDGDTLTVTMPERKYVAKVSLDSKAKPHATVDFKITEGPDDAVGRTTEGIYKVDGKTMTICIAAQNAARPKEFEQVENQSFVFKLKKP